MDKGTPTNHISHKLCFVAVQQKMRTKLWRCKTGRIRCGLLSPTKQLQYLREGHKELTLPSVCTMAQRLREETRGPTDLALGPSGSSR